MLEKTADLQVAKLTSELQASQQQVKDLTDSNKKALQEHNKAQSAVQSTESELHDLRMAFADLKVQRGPRIKLTCSCRLCACKLLEFTGARAWNLLLYVFRSIP